MENRDSRKSLSIEAMNLGKKVAVKYIDTYIVIISDCLTCSLLTPYFILQGIIHARNIHITNITVETVTLLNI